MDSGNGSTIPETIAGRYRVEGLLGRGGMGVVYQVADQRSGERLALKRLEGGGQGHPDVFAALFEREYHTLAQLEHPHIVEARDYGTAGGPYYTMELLAGPTMSAQELPWRDLCRHARDICSALSLLHSRRLIHRDVNVRNILLTREGRAKLIDFGVMAPMGPNARVVGTPPYVAPEMLQRQELDGRLDLYALGAVLYRGLTGRHAFSVRRFRDLPEAWSQRPPPPSSFGQDLPAGLDALVLSLLHRDREARPATAGEVMERLTAIADLPPVVDAAEQGAYLTTPTLVGRDALLEQLNALWVDAREGQSAAVVIDGPAGVGRSRMLDACVLAAKTEGALVVRAEGAGLRYPFRAAAQLAAELLDQAAELGHPGTAEHRARLTQLLPQLSDWLDAGARMSSPPPPLSGNSSRVETLRSLRGLFADVAREQMVCVAVDDAQLLDRQSRALLASLVQAASGRMIVLVTLCDDGATPEELQLLRDAATCWTLGPLDPAEVRALLASVFGETPNLDLLCGVAVDVAAGNPGDTMALAEHLRQKGHLRYERGLWHISPLVPADLPETMAATLRSRAGAASPAAQTVARLMAMSPARTFTVFELAQLCPDLAGRALHAALVELVAGRVLVADAERYRFRQAGWAAAFAEGLDAEARQALHLRLANMLEATAGDPLQAARHRLLGGDAHGLDVLLDRLGHRGSGTRTLAALGADAKEALEHALELIAREGRSPAQEYRVLWALVRLSQFGFANTLSEYEPRLRAHLVRDTGLVHLDTLDEPDPAARVKQAMKLAQHRWKALPEGERGLDPNAAIAQLVAYANVMQSVAAVTWDVKALPRSADLVEPFIPMIPLLQGVLIAARGNADQLVGRPVQAREKFLRLLSFLSSNEVGVEGTRQTLLFGVSMFEAYIGMPDCLERTRELESEPGFASAVWDVRRTLHLNLGDWDEAERCREQGEARLIEQGPGQFFGGGRNMLSPLGAHIAAGDMTALKLAVPSLAVLARMFPGFVAWRDVARGHYELLRGDTDAALGHFDAALERERAGTHAAWSFAAAGRVEALTRRGDAAQAVAWGRTAAGDAWREELWHPDLRRQLALAEAEMGEHAMAHARLVEAAGELRRFDIRGLHLGLVCEARARVALAQNDRAQFQQQLGRTLEELGRGSGPVLAARRQALADASRRTPGSAMADAAVELVSELETMLVIREGKTRRDTSA